MNMSAQTENLLKAEQRLAVAVKRVTASADEMLVAMREVRAALDGSLIALPTVEREGRMFSLTAERIESSGFTLTDLRSRRRDARICSVRFAVMQRLSDEGFGDLEIERFLNRAHGCMANMRSKDRSAQ